MPGNSFGEIFRITTFGESHGAMMGVVIDGCPAGLEIDTDFINTEMQRRKPGQSNITTQRKEDDSIEIVSGVFEGKSTGTPIAILIPNNNAKPRDYEHIKESYRPSHADFTFQEKYGIRDYRGGGRASARETACRVAAGAIAKQFLRKSGIKINAYVSAVGNIKVQKHYSQLDLSLTENNKLRCPDQSTAGEMEVLIKSIRKSGNTVGGVVTGIVQGCPTGLGEPVFDKLHADLGKAMLSINAVKGFEYGSGFEGSKMCGSDHNDTFVEKDGKISTKSNFSGGIQGGISNGMDIYFNVAFKPVATLMQDQQSVNKEGKTVKVEGKGRHDPCVVPRAVPIVEAMTALVLADHLLRNQSSKIK
ncbi:MAG: chorismate synthase [Chitinophagales bacterium]